MAGRAGAGVGRVRKKKWQLIILITGKSLQGNKLNFFTRPLPPSLSLLWNEATFSVSFRIFGQSTRYTCLPTSSYTLLLFALSVSLLLLFHPGWNGRPNEDGSTPSLGKTGVAVAWWHIHHQGMSKKQSSVPSDLRSHHAVHDKVRTKYPFFEMDNSE